MLTLGTTRPLKLIFNMLNKIGALPFPLKSAGICAILILNAVFERPLQLKDSASGE